MLCAIVRVLVYHCLRVQIHGKRKERERETKREKWTTSDDGDDDRKKKKLVNKKNSSNNNLLFWIWVGALFCVHFSFNLSPLSFLFIMQISHTQQWTYDSGWYDICVFYLFGHERYEQAAAACCRFPLLLQNTQTHTHIRNERKLSDSPFLGCWLIKVIIFVYSSPSQQSL